METMSDVGYDVVIECDYLGGLPVSVCDTWARGMQQRLSVLFDGDPDVDAVRVVRAGCHVKTSLGVTSHRGAGSVISTALGVLWEHRPESVSNVVVHLGRRVL